MNLAEDFGNQLQIYWEIESSKSLFSEIQQFRALMRCFSLMGSSFRIEEFHGTKHQVIFNGEGSWGRTAARCELSDLVIISYKTKPKFDARITFLQAKKSNDSFPFLCNSYSFGTPLTKFNANLEQWDLLSRRPHLLPYPPFDCHPDILQGAILASIGSLGVFHKIKNNEYNFFYMPADIATPFSSPKKKYAKLQFKGNGGVREKHGFFERQYACCIRTFGEALFNLEIGSPFSADSCINIKDEKYRDKTRAWARGLLDSHIEMNNQKPVLARELREFTQSEEESPFFKETPSILMVNTDETYSLL